jgi:hypothetical protein
MSAAIVIEIIDVVSFQAPSIATNCWLISIIFIKFKLIDTYLHLLNTELRRLARS